MGGGLLSIWMCQASWHELGDGSKWIRKHWNNMEVDPLSIWMCQPQWTRRWILVNQAYWKHGRWIMSIWCVEPWHELDDGSWWIKPYWKTWAVDYCQFDVLSFQWHELMNVDQAHIEIHMTVDQCQFGCVKPQLTWTDDGSWWIKPHWNNILSSHFDIFKPQLTWN
jgi:hypothetical protein